MRFAAALIIAIGFAVAAGCIGCESEITHTSDRCPDNECVACSDHDDCDDGAFCGEDQGEQVCLIQKCEPNATECDGDSVMRCDDAGSGFHDPVDCPAGCEGGECACEDIDDCATGESCVDDRCTCPTDVRCGDAGACCGEAEICAPAEVCDSDGNCETTDICQPECSGEYCGDDNEICCEGDEPVCSPFGECVPDCGADSQLCGDNFDTCCDTGDVCIFGDCVTPGDPCDDMTECSFGEYCDEGLGKCMPDDFPDDIECSMEGDFMEFDAEEKWSFTEDNTTSTPVVGDVTGDGETNVVFLSMDDDSVIILDNQGNEVERIEHDPANDSYGAHWRSNPALADVTGDGQMEIIYPTAQPQEGCCRVTTHIAASDGDGELVWLAHDESGDPVDFRFNTGAISAANLNGDSSTAEIMAGAALIDSQGRVVANEGGDANEYGSSGGYTGGLTIAVDLLGDGQHELVTGRHAWTVDWDEPSDPTEWPDVDVDLLWENNDGADGYPAVADMDGNGQPEVVLFAERTLRILDGQTGELWCGVDPTGDACDDDDSLRTQPTPDPSGTGGRGGPPTVADFSGDGRPEVGVAGNSYYTVFDINRPGFGDDDSPEEIDEDLLDEFGQDDPELGEIFIRWYHPSQDASQATGSSVFDFQGDGSASVVYNDECYLRVYSGYDGEIELKLQNSTGTRIEYPIVVDVDENGRSEIVVSANDQSRDCDDWEPDDPYERRSGIYVYEDPNELWVHTRSIWNQHAYSIDNIHDDGSTPDLVDDWWETHNTFRANRQGEVPLHAPDVTVSSVQADDVLCPQQPIEFRATIENQGKRVITEGLPVSLYNADTGELLATKVLDESISPGGMVEVRFEYEIPSADINNDVTYTIVANDEDAEDGEPVADCDPDTASAQVSALCYVPG